MFNNKEAEQAFSEIENAIDAEIKRVEKIIRYYTKLSPLSYVAHNLIPGYGFKYGCISEAGARQAFLLAKKECLKLLPTKNVKLNISFNPVTPDTRAGGFFTDLVEEQVSLLSQYIEALENLKTHFYEICENLK